MRRLVVTEEGEVRQPSLKSGKQLPMRQHTGMPKFNVPGSAPHKTDMASFPSKHGVPGNYTNAPGSFGNTGL
jgi:hypothetical protein